MLGHILEIGVPVDRCWSSDYLIPLSPLFPPAGSELIHLAMTTSGRRLVLSQHGAPGTTGTPTHDDQSSR
jgi:hypothetical protein